MTSYLRRKNRSGLLKGEKNQYGVWDHLFEHQWMKGWGNRRHLSKDVGTFSRYEKNDFLIFLSHTSNHQKSISIIYFQSIISITLIIIAQIHVSSLKLNNQRSSRSIVLEKRLFDLFVSHSNHQNVTKLF